MKEIPLSQGMVAIVDDEDYGWLSAWKWYAWESRPGKWYACRNISMKTGKRGLVFMHREIMKTPLDMETDHINSNGLDCRKENMRTCKHQQNQRNQRTQGKSKYSIFKGVTWSLLHNKWKAQININNKSIYLGLFESVKVDGAVPYDVGECAAALKYDIVAKERFGEFASLNFIEV
jgi:hypothetical protein